MSAVQQLKPAADAVQPGQVVIRGRVDSSKKRGDARYTRVLCPAVDAYSRPQTLEVRSKASQTIGQAGDEVTFRAQLGGYAKRPRSWTDKSTGEQATIVEVVHTLDFVEG